MPYIWKYFLEECKNYTNLNLDDLISYRIKYDLGALEGINGERKVLGRAE